MSQEDDDLAAMWAQAESEEHQQREAINVDMTKYAGSEGKFLKAADIEGKLLKVKIASVEIVEFDKDDGSKETKPAIGLVGKEKKVVCNPSNTKALISAFGADAGKWTGKDIQLSTQHYASLGKSGIVITPLVGDLNDDIPF